MKLNSINESEKNPIIGKIKTIPLSDDFESEDYNIIAIKEKDGIKYYITDQWYKPGVRQIIPSSMVADFQKA